MLTRVWLDLETSGAPGRKFARKFPHMCPMFPWMFPSMFLGTFPCTLFVKVYMFCNFGTPKSPIMFNIVFPPLKPKKSQGLGGEEKWAGRVWQVEVVSPFEEPLETRWANGTMLKCSYYVICSLFCHRFWEHDVAWILL